MEPKRNQGCQIRKTDKNGIKIRITGQGNDENRQKNEKINVNQQRSHLAINTPGYQVIKISISNTTF
mgnify:CR=1 FL=1